MISSEAKRSSASLEGVLFVVCLDSLKQTKYKDLPESLEDLFGSRVVKPGPQA